MEDQLKEYLDTICLFLDRPSDKAKEMIMLILESAYKDGRIAALKEQLERLQDS